MLRIRICRLHFETGKVLFTYFVRCDMNGVTIPHAFVLRKTLCTTSSVSERGDMDSENHSMVIRSIGSHSLTLTFFFNFNILSHHPDGFHVEVFDLDLI